MSSCKIGDDSFSTVFLFVTHCSLSFKNWIIDTFFGSFLTFVEALRELMDFCRVSLLMLALPLWLCLEGATLPKIDGRFVGAFKLSFLSLWRMQSKVLYSPVFMRILLLKIILFSDGTILWIKAPSWLPKNCFLSTFLTIFNISKLLFTRWKQVLLSLLRMNMSAPQPSSSKRIS